MTLSGSSVSVLGVSRFSDDSYGQLAGVEKNTKVDRNTLLAVMEPGASALPLHSLYRGGAYRCPSLG